LTPLLIVFVEHRDEVGKEPTGIVDVAMLLVLGVLSLFVAINFLDVFASGVYPYVPQQFGGGKPVEIRLVASSNTSSPLGATGLDILETEIISRRLDLLWETHQMYIVRTAGDEDANILHIDKDQVAAVIGELRSMAPLVDGTSQGTASMSR